MIIHSLIILLVPDEVRNHSVLDRTTSPMGAPGVWYSSSSWNGPPAALYRGFDDPYDVILMEDTAVQITLVSGKVRSIKHFVSHR